MSIIIYDKNDVPREFSRSVDALNFIRVNGGRLRPEDEERLKETRILPKNSLPTKEDCVPIEIDAGIELPEYMTSCSVFSSVRNQKSPKRFSEFLTVIGTADCVKSDVQKWGLIGDVAVVNDMGFYGRRFHHFVTVHAELIPIVRTYRTKWRAYHKCQYQTHTALGRDVGFTNMAQQWADYQWHFRPLFRSSGLLAVWIGLALGYKGILTLGIPLSESNHFYDVTGETAAIKNYPNFLERISQTDIPKGFFQNVRAASGPFSDYVGKPTRKWINSKLEGV